jgi:hypothetical protein
MTRTVTGLSTDHLSPAAAVSPAPHQRSTNTDALDPSFVFDFRAYDDPDSANQRWSTWAAAERESLRWCWTLELPVPYPVRIDGERPWRRWRSAGSSTATCRRTTCWLRASASS